MTLKWPKDLWERELRGKWPLSHHRRSPTRLDKKAVTGGGDKAHAIYVLGHSGEIIEERSITNHRDSLRRLSNKYPEARIAMEVGTHSPWI